MHNLRSARLWRYGASSVSGACSGANARRRRHASWRRGLTRAAGWEPVAVAACNGPSRGLACVITWRCCTADGGLTWGFLVWKVGFEPPASAVPRSGSIARSRTPVAVCEIAEFGRGHRAGSLSVSGGPRGGKAAVRKRSSSPESELCFPRASGKRGGGVACPLCAPGCGSTHPGSHVSERRAPFGGARRPPEVRETQTPWQSFAVSSP